MKFGRIKLEKATHMSSLIHFDSQGQAHMVDIDNKSDSNLKGLKGEIDYIIEGIRSFLLYPLN